MKDISNKFFDLVKTIFWRWIVMKLITVIASILLFIYLITLFDNEYIAAILITISEKTVGRDAQLTHYLIERTHRDLYSPLNLLKVEIDDHHQKEDTVHVIIDDAKVDTATISVIDKLRKSNLSEDDKKYLKNLNLELLNLRFKVLNGEYLNNKKHAMLELQKIINENAEKKHSCFDHNATVTFIHQPIFQLSKNIVVYSEELSTDMYTKELEKFNKDQSININSLPIVHSAYFPSLILTNIIIGTCSEN